MELSQGHVQRIRAIRTAVENELRLLDVLLAQLTDPERKRTIAVARRDVANMEGDLLRNAAESPDPNKVLAAAGHRLAIAVAARKAGEKLWPEKR